MSWCIADKNEYIDIIAPAGTVSLDDLTAIKAYLHKLGLRPRIPDNILSDHPLCANTDAMRFELLRASLMAEDSSLIWCVRGGHGVTRIMPELMRLKKPTKQKLLIGISDISSLHLWLNQIWQWPSLHGPSARQAALGKIDARDIAAVHQLCFEGLENYLIADLLPLNALAQKQPSIAGIATGGCISILQNSIGTPWQIDTKNKILFLEDVNEPPYRIDRALVHLVNTGLLRQVKAIIFGDFCERATETEKLEWVLTESIPSYLVQQGIEVPLFRLHGFGHNTRNKPLPFGVMAHIATQGSMTQLTFQDL